MQIGVLGEPEHHLNHQEPDLLIRPQNLLGVALDHLHEDLEDPLEQGDQFAILLEEELELDGVDEELLSGEGLAVSDWDQVPASILHHVLNIHAELLEVADVQVLRV